MISHSHKCIFIHIPRTAGSSIEVALQGKDQWVLEPDTKHLIASTAKKLYKDYWDEYFKFSFVRNPWARMVSMSRFSFYGCAIKNNLLCVKGYVDKFSPIEIDPRTESEKDRSNISVIQDAVYLNILNEDLDFIGRFENLQEDFSIVCDNIGMPRTKLPHHRKSKPCIKKKSYTLCYDDKTREVVGSLYKKDIEHFGYKFGE